jgi:tRNA1Val (adenine37-N6)-methyltransferase
MKVCTDACLFGGWLAQDDGILNSNNILDIGAGTGLLSLMVAQANKEANITAIEIEPYAAKQATQNFIASPWSERLHVINNALQNYGANAQNTFYDCIISNPPFYETDLQSPNSNKNIALHSTALPWVELLQNVSNLLASNGNFFVLIPAIRAYTMQKIAAQHNLNLVAEVVIFNAAKQKPFRVIQKYSFDKQTTLEVKRSNFIIKDFENKYTTDFTQLLKDYYLQF